MPASLSDGECAALSYVRIMGAQTVSDETGMPVNVDVCTPGVAASQALYCRG